MKKDKRKYNLALKNDAGKEAGLPTEHACLNMISEVPESPSYQEISVGRPLNMFQTDSLYNGNRIKESSPYSVLCRPEVEAYKFKIKKTKNVGILRMKVSDSFLSSSRHTGTFAELANYNDCLTKEELAEFYQRTKDEAKRAKVIDAQKPSYSERGHCHQLPSLTACWTSRARQKGAAMKLSLSNGRMIHNHRKRMEQLAKLTLKCQKENIQPWSWMGNLRKPDELRSLLDGRYVEEIQREGLKLKGENKLDKEFQWVGQRKNQLYEPLEGKTKFVKKSVQANSKEFNQALSRTTNFHEV